MNKPHLHSLLERFVLHMPNIINLYTTWSAQAVNSISEDAIRNSSKPIKFPHLWKLVNQSTLNKANMIEITKACKFAFMKARNFVVVRYEEERVNWE